MKKSAFNYKKFMGILGGLLLAIQSLLLAFEIHIDNNVITTILNTTTGFLVAMGIVSKTETNEYIDKEDVEDDSLDDINKNT